MTHSQGPEAQNSGEQLLAVEGLKVSFHTEDGIVQAVDEVSFELTRGEIVGIVGESGSGKSVTAMTLMGLTRARNAAISGRATIAGVDLVSASESELQRVRGKRIAMIFQDPMTALNPVQRIGAQIVEQICAHEPVGRKEAHARAVNLLDRVGIPQAAKRAQAFPHELSGGMRQRVMIAMALSCSPEILIADEPTTALDVTIQAQILAEIRALREETEVSMLLITHDLGVVADVADRVLVMYGGRVVEQGTLDDIFYDPLHPYTWGLLGSVPRVDQKRPDRLPTIPGAPPSLLKPPEGCHFAPRCPWSFDSCSEAPALTPEIPDVPGHLARCWIDLPSKRKHRMLGNTIGLPPLRSDVTASNKTNSLAGGSAQ